jgi:hypothetical protein
VATLRSDLRFGVYGFIYRDKKVVGVFVRFACAITPEQKQA